MQIKTFRKTNDTQHWRISCPIIPLTEWSWQWSWDTNSHTRNWDIIGNETWNCSSKAFSENNSEVRFLAFELRRIFCWQLLGQIESRHSYLHNDRIKAMIVGSTFYDPIRNHEMRELAGTCRLPDTHGSLTHKKLCESLLSWIELNCVVISSQELLMTKLLLSPITSKTTRRMTISRLTFHWYYSWCSRKALRKVVCHFGDTVGHSYNPCRKLGCC
jgi:hypothetical protein